MMNVRIFRVALSLILVLCLAGCAAPNTVMRPEMPAEIPAMHSVAEFSDDEQGIDLEALAARYADSVFWSNATQPGQGDLFD